MKQKRTKLLFLMLIAWLFSSIICIVTLWIKFPCTKISLNEFYGSDYENLKDFSFSDNSLFSTTVDPWVSYSFPEEKDILIIDINQSKILTKGLSANIYDPKTWIAYPYVPKNGHNLVITHGLRANQLRFDLVENLYQPLQIKSITLNDRFFISILVLIISSTILFLCMLAVSLWSIHKTSYKRFVLLLLFLFAILITFVIYFRSSTPFGSFTYCLLVSLYLCIHLHNQSSNL